MYHTKACNKCIRRPRSGIFNPTSIGRILHLSTLDIIGDSVFESKILQYYVCHMLYYIVWTHWCNFFSIVECRAKVMATNGEWWSSALRSPMRPTPKPRFNRQRHLYSSSTATVSSFDLSIDVVKIYIRRETLVYPNSQKWIWWLCKQFWIVSSSYLHSCSANIMFQIDRRLCTCNNRTGIVVMPMISLLKWHSITMTINSQDRVDLGIFDTLVQWSDRRVYLGPTPGNAMDNSTYSMQRVNLYEKG